MKTADIQFNWHDLNGAGKANWTRKWMISQNSKTQLSFGMKHISMHKFVRLDDESQTQYVELNNTQQHSTPFRMEILNHALVWFLSSSLISLTAQNHLLLG